MEQEKIDKFFKDYPKLHNIFESKDEASPEDIVDIAILSLLQEVLSKDIKIKELGNEIFRLHRKLEDKNNQLKEVQRWNHIMQKFLKDLQEHYNFGRWKF
jgi:hypothetical protein